jgi:predicted MPP superfamily phosphohydrolase
MNRKTFFRNSCIQIIPLSGWNSTSSYWIESKYGRVNEIGRQRVQISDLLFCSVRGSTPILKLVRAAEPDILVSTGDLVDGHQKHFSGIEKYFLEVRPRLGKFAIMGNHEYYVGIEKSIAFTKESGFKVLMDENFELGGLISITGIDDSQNSVERTALSALEKKLLQAAPSGVFRLILKHRPIVEKESEGKFDLQLSGHVHKGQIFPFNFLTWLSFPVKTGLTRLKGGGWLYVSRGTGVWGPPIRFLAPPEVTIIDLMPESAINIKN